MSNIVPYQFEFDFGYMVQTDEMSHKSLMLFIDICVYVRNGSKVKKKKELFP